MANSLVKKRKIDIVVISDVHLGTYGCQAKELLNYLESIKPKKVILNGDIIDIWQFKKSYWPKEHMHVIKHIIKWITDDVEVYYITGNHDEMLRKFVNFKMNSFQIVNKLVLKLDNKTAWFFHGDVFDVTMKHSKWLAKLGAKGYDLLILINSLVNRISSFFGKGKISLSKKIKNSVKSAVKHINNFEKTAVDIAAENNFDYVVCGHIHHPKKETYRSLNKDVTYLNSGDWVENLTALEYHKSKWSIYRYNEKEFEFLKLKNESTHVFEKSNKEIFNELLADFNLIKA
ncbi:MAG: UDP-2,3-diacylglucosamine diphosphatase [Flavobacteriales bacterium]|nr:UDP-2,3-diacylglucosamine diphosphatase [Flavobacteriales bacterium]NCP61392.1 UDP-2,3-diacylglucosamine diphosphatase [Flavobacteriales bacterium]NCP91006.1 UDP-2,3-diacylglucosamine diphosphatase [Flavobacteriales bacterium]